MDFQCHYFFCQYIYIYISKINKILYNNIMLNKNRLKKVGFIRYSF